MGWLIATRVIQIALVVVVGVMVYEVIIQNRRAR